MPVSRLAEFSGHLVTSAPIDAGRYLYRAGDPASCHYHVRSGAFKTCAVNAAGDEFVTGFFFPGELIGCAQRDGLHCDSAVALEVSTVCALGAGELPGLWANGFGGRLQTLMADREARAAQHAMNLVQTRADARVAGYLLLLAERLGSLGWRRDVLPMPMSRTDLAGYLGMTLESLSRVFSRFTQAGLIRATRSHVEILDLATLTTVGYHAVA